jgi:hypothetical protein
MTAEDIPRIVGSLATTASEITHDESARFFPGEHFSFCWICAEGRMFEALAVFGRAARTR